MQEDFVITRINHVVFVGPDKYSEKKTVFRKNLTSHELIFHFSGKATVYFDKQILHTAPNVIRFLPQGTVSRYEVERQEPGSCIDIFFQTDKPVSTEAFNYCAGEDSQLGVLFRRLFTLWVTKKAGSYFECMSLLYCILSQMQYKEYAPKAKMAQIDQAVDYINDNFINPSLQVETLAQMCGISYSYMKKLFVSRFGLPPKQYIIQLKMNYARELLSTGRYSIAQVAEQCGFRDVYFFSRQFKAHTGVPPSRYVLENSG